MLDTIDRILDLTTKFLIDEYNFTTVSPSLRLSKADKAYKDNSGNDYRCVQVVVAGEFEYEGVTYEAYKEVAILTYADATYEEVLTRALKEIQNPGDNTRWAVEYLIAKPLINKSKQAELV
jgi:hypothetical protein